MRRALTALLVALGAWACSSPDPVQALMEELEEAAEARDADRFARRLSPAFRGGNAMPRAEALATLRRYFAGYESIALTVYGTEVERSGGQARIRCVVEFSGDVRKLGGLEGLLPPQAAYRFELDAADEEGEWRVRSARWEAVPASPQ